MPAAITAENVIRKLGFVMYGANFAEHKETMKRDMYRYHRVRADKIISRQAIKNWFDKDAVPKRVDAITFIYLFFISSVDRTTRSNEQKQVYDQLHQFFNAMQSQDTYQVAGVEFYKPHVSAGGRHSTLQLQLPLQTQDVIDEILGEYALFHYRLIEDARGDIAVERLEVFRKGHSVIGRIRFLDVASSMNTFEGEFFRVGTLIWYIGKLQVAEGQLDRVRVMAFRRNGTEKDPYDALKWGLMLSDIPHPTSHIPASCRVVLLRLDKYGLGEGPQVGAVKSSELTGSEWQTIGRLIDNNTTSISEHNTVEPLSRMEIFNENILKTDHRTIERACELFRREGYRRFWQTL